MRKIIFLFSLLTLLGGGPLGHCAIIDESTPEALAIRNIKRDYPHISIGIIEQDLKRRHHAILLEQILQNTPTEIQIFSKNPNVLSLITEALKQNTSVQKATVNAPSLFGKGDEKTGAEVGSALKQILTHNKSIQIMDIGFVLGKDGIQSLAEGLKVNTTVKELHLNYCHILSDGIIAIVKALSTNPDSKLEVLHIGIDRIGSRGLVCMNHYLKTSGKNIKAHLGILNTNKTFITDDLHPNLSGTFVKKSAAELRAKGINVVKNQVTHPPMGVKAPGLTATEGAEGAIAVGEAVVGTVDLAQQLGSTAESLSNCTIS